MCRECVVGRKNGNWGNYTPNAMELETVGVEMSTVGKKGWMMFNNKSWQSKTNATSVIAVFAWKLAIAVEYRQLQLRMTMRGRTTMLSMAYQLS